MSWEVCSLLGEESRGVDVGMRGGGLGRVEEREAVVEMYCRINKN